MDNQITCPKCGKVIANHPVIDSAVNGENRGSTFIICDCGERITFWAITAQLREQKTPGKRFQKWIQGLSKSKA
jgi:hypothetical protein